MATGGRTITFETKLTKTKNLMCELLFWMKINPYTMKIMHRKIKDKKKR